MKKLLLLPAALLVLAGCGSESAKEAAENIVTCMNDQDYNCVVEYMSEPSIKQIEQQLDKMRQNAPMKTILAKKLGVSEAQFDNMDGKTFAAKMLEDDMNRANNATITVENVDVSEDGKTALITTKRGDDTSELPLKKIDDKWYMNN